MSKILDWLLWANERVADLISRKAETSSESGWDPSPSVRPCEHRLEWMREKLCLGCDNTGFRPLTAKERDEGSGIDPYSLDVPAVKGGWSVSTNTEESAAQKRSAWLALLNEAIARMERDAAMREGRGVRLDTATRDILKLSVVPPTLQKIEKALLRLRTEKEHLYWKLPNDQEALFQLSLWVPGQIRPAPSV